MKRFRKRRPSAGLIVASLALVVALTGANAYAAATNFLLNTSNTSTAQTTLNGSAVASKASLQITNTNAQTGATALGLKVASGHPPFTVNSSSKVGKLNADLLDGIDSTGFTQGANTKIIANRIVVAVPASGTTSPTVLTMPGLGSIVADCGTTIVGAHYTNTSTNTIDGWVSDSGGGWSEDPYPPNAGVGDFGDEANLSLGTGTSTGGRTVAIVQEFSSYVQNGTACAFQAQATIWHG